GGSGSGRRIGCGCGFGFGKTNRLGVPLASTQTPGGNRFCRRKDSSGSLGSQGTARPGTAGEQLSAWEYALRSQTGEPYLSRAGRKAESQWHPRRLQIPLRSGKCASEPAFARRSAWLLAISEYDRKRIRIGN